MSISKFIVKPLQSGIARSVGREITITPPVISCTYPLDASEIEIQEVGYAGKLVMSEEDQTGQYTVQSGLVSNETYIAAPVNITLGTSAKLDFSGTGKKVVELQVQQFDLNNLSQSDGYTVGITITNSSLTTLYTVYFTTGSAGSGSYNLGVSGNGFGGDVVLLSDISAPLSAAIVYDGTTGQVYVRYNGVNYATTSAALGDMVGVLSVEELSGASSGVAGNVVRGRFETNASSFIGSYEVGSTDVCGNTI